MSCTFTPSLFSDGREVSRADAARILRTVRSKGARFGVRLTPRKRIYRWVCGPVGFDAASVSVPRR